MEGVRAFSATADAVALTTKLSSRRLGSVLGILLVTCFAVPSVASADRYQFGNDLGSPGVGAGQLNQPKDVAVDESSGVIYVADTGNHRVVSFDSDGTFLAAWGWGVSDGAAASQVCTSGCQAGLPGAGPGQFTSPRFIEVDNSDGESAGDVYVANQDDGLLQKFDSGGNLVAGWGEGGELDFGHDAPIAGITVDDVGNLYVVTAQEPYFWTEVSPDGQSQTRWPSDGTEGGELGMNLGTPATAGIEISKAGVFYEPQAYGQLLYSRPDSPYEATEDVYECCHQITITGLAIDRPRNDVYVDRGDRIEQFAGRCAVHVGCELTDTFGSGELEEAGGIAISSSTAAVYAANTNAGKVTIFEPRPVPEVATGAATEIAATSGTLTGHVDPGDGEIDECRFEYVDGPLRDETQTLTVEGASGGTYTVSFGGETVGPFEYQWEAGTIGYALRELPSIGFFNLRVPPGGGPFTFEWVNDLSQTNVPQLVVDDSQLTPAGAHVTVKTLSDGHGWQDGSSIPCSQTTPITSPTDVSAQLTGLTPLQTYDYRLRATRADGGGNAAVGEIQTLTPMPTLIPDVADSNASPLSATEATVSGEVNPRGIATTYHVEYGTDASYGVRTAFDVPVGDDETSHAVSSTISGLQPSTVYHARIVATNLNGSRNGPDQVFLTPGPPSVGAVSVSDITATSAALHVEVTPWLRPTEVHFEYGPSPAYRGSTAAVAIGSDTALHSLQSVVSNLVPGTTYHVRAVATNAVGTVSSPDQTFVTPPASSPKVTPLPGRCKRGFVRKRGKCVKKPRKHRRHKGHRARG